MWLLAGIDVWIKGGRCRVTEDRKADGSLVWIMHQ